MSKIHIAVDVDEVLFPFVDAFLAEYNKDANDTLNAEDFFTYEFQHVLDLSVAETIRRVHLIHEQGYNHEPLKGAVQALRTLAKLVDISIVTARNPKFEIETRRWLDRHFGPIFQNIVLIGHPEDMGILPTKAEICQRIGAQYLIDDTLAHVQACSRLGIQGILFGDYAWNRDVDVPTDVIVCKNWPEVLELFHDKR